MLIGLRQSVGRELSGASSTPVNKAMALLHRWIGWRGLSESKYTSSGVILTGLSFIRSTCCITSGLVFTFSGY